MGSKAILDIGIHFNESNLKNCYKSFLINPLMLFQSSSMMGKGHKSIIRTESLTYLVGVLKIKILNLKICFRNYFCFFKKINRYKIAF